MGLVQGEASPKCPRGSTGGQHLRCPVTTPPHVECLWRHHWPQGPTPQIPPTTCGRSNTWNPSPQRRFLKTKPADPEGPGFHAMQPGQDPFVICLQKRELCFLNPSSVSVLFLHSPLLPYFQTSDFFVSLIILKYVTNLPSQIELSPESTVLCQCLPKAAALKHRLACRTPVPAPASPLGLSSSD